MALPEEEIKDLLDAGGFLGSWVDGRGNTQPNPVVQIGMLRESEIGRNRCIVIRKNGGSSADEYLRNPNLVIYFLGYESDGHLIIAERMDEMIGYILDNYQSGCIMSVTAQGDVNGPFMTDSGRPVYELNLQTIRGT